MKFPLIALAGILIFAGSGESESASSETKAPWRVVSQQGKIHFVVVDGMDKNNFRLAMANVCKSGTDCLALLWKTGDDIPTSLPMSDSQIEQMIGLSSTQSNSPSSQEHRRWNCKIFPADQSLCLTKEFVAGVVNQY